MNGGHVLFGIFVLIFAFLALSNWKAANTLLSTGASSANTYTRTLQGR